MPFFSDKGKFLLDVDHIPAIGYPKIFGKSWPVMAYEFMFRNRSTSKWPSKKLINKIIENGCHLVPKEARSGTDEGPR